MTVSSQFQVPRHVWIDGIGAIAVDASNTIASGSFGTVLRQPVNNRMQALKLLHKYDPNVEKKVKYIQLHASKWNLPSNSAFPLRISRVDKNGEFNGFLMRLFDSTAREISTLFNETFREQNQISMKDIILFFKHAFSDLSIISQYLVIHDLSKRNLLHYRSSATGELKPGWIDMESAIVIGQDFGDPVTWTRFIADPLSIDPMTNKSVGKPNPGNDRYQLLHHLFNALLGYTPFDGFHPNFFLEEERIARGAWVFDAGVNAPPTGIPRDVVSDELMQLFEDYFKKQLRYEVSLQLLEDYANSLGACSTCGTEYPNTLKLCPKCQVTSQHYVPPMALTKELINAVGRIIKAEFTGRHVMAVALENNHAVVYRRPMSGDSQKFVLFPLEAVDRGIRFEFLDENTFAINRPQSERSEKIEIWKLDASGASLVETTSSNPYYGNHQLVPYRGSQGNIIRIIGNSMKIGRLQHPIGLVEENVPVSVSRNQTWFWANQTQSQIVSITTYPGNTIFEVVIGGPSGRRTTLNIPQINVNNERLDDISVRFDENAILIRMKTLKGFSEMIYTYVLKIENDNTVTRVQHPYEQQIAKDDNHPNTRQITFSSDKNGYYIWHPTDKGIVCQSIETNTFELIDTTTGGVLSSDSLHHIGAGKGSGKHFLVIRKQNIIYMKLN